MNMQPVFLAQHQDAQHGQDRDHDHQGRRGLFGGTMFHHRMHAQDQRHQTVDRAAIMKKVDTTIASPATAGVALIAAGAARPTPTIDSAKAGSSWA
jgi:hypothetical protein